MPRLSIQRLAVGMLFAGLGLAACTSPGASPSPSPSGMMEESPSAGMMEESPSAGMMEKSPSAGMMEESPSP